MKKASVADDPAEDYVPTLITESEISPSRYSVLGVMISAIDMERAVSIADAHIRSRKQGYICVTDVNVVMEAQKTPGLLDILNHSVITTPDGAHCMGRPSPGTS